VSPRVSPRTRNEVGAEGVAGVWKPASPRRPGCGGPPRHRRGAWSRSRSAEPGAATAPASASATTRAAVSRSSSLGPSAGGRSSGRARCTARSKRSAQPLARAQREAERTAAAHVDLDVGGARRVRRGDDVAHRDAETGDRALSEVEAAREASARQRHELAAAPHAQRRADRLERGPRGAVRRRAPRRERDAHAARLPDAPPRAARQSLGTTSKPMPVSSITPAFRARSPSDSASANTSISPVTSR
jgi:hypothetical protein